MAKMLQGRGSAAIVIMMVAMVVVTTHFPVADAATYTVGDARGWTFNVATWPGSKKFRAGDTLVFNYSPQAHNVVRVDRVGYQRCTTPRGARPTQSGKDQIKLNKGQNYFICNIPGHCQSGMKIAINAL